MRKKFDLIDLFIVVGCLFISFMVFLIVNACRSRPVNGGKWSFIVLAVLCVSETLLALFLGVRSGVLTPEEGQPLIDAAPRGPAAPETSEISC